MAKYENGYTKVMTGMFGEFPANAGMFKSAFRQQAAITDKMSRVVLAAAEKSTEISATWTKSTLGELGNVTNAQDDPSDYTKAINDFAIAQAELGAKSVEALADVATTAQVRAFELMLAADKDPVNGASKAARKPRSGSGQPASPAQVDSKAVRKAAKDTSSTAGKVALKH